MSTLNNRCRIKIGTQNGTIVLTTTQKIVYPNTNSDGSRLPFNHGRFLAAVGFNGLQVEKTQKFGIGSSIVNPRKLERWNMDF